MRELRDSGFFLLNESNLIVNVVYAPAPGIRIIINGFYNLKIDLLDFQSFVSKFHINKEQQTFRKIASSRRIQILISKSFRLYCKHLHICHIQSTIYLLSLLLKFSYQLIWWAFSIAQLKYLPQHFNCSIQSTYRSRITPTLHSHSIKFCNFLKHMQHSNFLILHIIIENQVIRKTYGKFISFYRVKSIFTTDKSLSTLFSKEKTTRLNISATSNLLLEIHDAYSWRQLVKNFC